MSSNWSLWLPCLLGVQGRDFSMLAADTMNLNTVLVMNNDMDRLHEISENMVLGVNGEAGDISQLTQFIAKNLQLYKMRNKYQLDAPAVAHFIRKNLADSLRAGNSCNVNMILASHDKERGGQLYLLDFLATCLEVPYAVHGLAGLFCVSLLDRYYKPDLSEPEAYEILKMCVREVQLRLVVNLPRFRVKMVSKHGITSLPDITTAMLQK